MKHLLYIAAFSLSLWQIAPAYAGHNEPVAAPQITTVTPPAIGDSSAKPDTTANSQNRLSHVANATAVAGWANTAFPVEVDGYATPGDGGRKRMVYDSANACGAGGHPAADGVTCVNSTVGGGSWNIDWSSTNFVAPISLFETNAGNATNSATVETAALQAALNTGYDVYLPVGSATGNITPGTYNILAGTSAATAVSFKKINQRLFGPGSGQVTLQCGLAASPGTINPCLNTNGMAGARIEGVGMYYPSAPNTTSTSDKAGYGPLVFAQNTPNMRWRDVLLTRANTDVDMKGNSGGGVFEDMKFSCFSICWDIDGSEDTVIFSNPHGFPYYLNVGTQDQVFFKSATSWNVGRMDDFQVRGGLNIGHLAFQFYNDTNGFGGNSSMAGAVLGTIHDFDCDTFACITMLAGNLGVSNLKSTYGTDPGQAGILATGGTLVLSNPTFFMAISLANPMIDVYGTAVVSVNGGQTTYASGIDNIAMRDGYSTSAGGEMTIVGHRFVRPQGTSGAPAAYKNPMVFAYSPLTAIGNTPSAIGTTGSGTGVTNIFLQVNDNCASRVVGNPPRGWTQTLPTGSPCGTYLAN